MSTSLRTSLRVAATAAAANTAAAASPPTLHAVAGTLLLVVFVAWKMRRRVRCSCACWGLADPADAERRRVLAAAAVLYQAAATDPDFK